MQIRAFLATDNFTPGPTCLMPGMVLFAIAGLAWIGSQQRANSTEPVDFSADVLPILSKTCFPCHGPDDAARQAELRLDVRAGALRTTSPVIMPHNGSGSPLVQRVVSRDPDQRMPPPDAKRQLTNAEIELLRRWIDEGAVWGEHWSFQPVRPPDVPNTQNRTWSRQPLDSFVLQQLESLAIAPSPPANRETWLRRVSLDLIGLTPTPYDRAAFLSDNRPDAYERAVDRLLASPHYGERWGRHWLDGARYADSTGFETDAPRSMWKYRDWVIHALNQDMPFDEFAVKQLAGDLVPGATLDDRIATGFLLNSQQDGGSEPSRLDAVVDRLNTLGTVFLGMTLGCAQCHAHKFDPITQREYYELFAFVNAADDRLFEFANAEELARRDALQAQLESLQAERTTYAAKLAAGTADKDPGYLERTATIEALTARVPKFEGAWMMQPAPTRVTTMYERGEFSRPGEVVSPNVPHVLPPMTDGPRTRLEFAHWLVSPQHPLTSRVFVNRVWQQFFGRGLVETENDFGTQGSRPSHPALLDWLAFEFSRSGWSIKALHRQIVLSATYRQSSNRREDLERVDVENRWLARQLRLRFEAEIVRDAALTVSGLLSTRLGGPSVFPFQHEGIMLNRATPAPWIMSRGEDRYRRGMYTHFWRLTPHPQLQTFDAPDAITSCTRRRPTNTPLQSLALMNDPTFVEAAEAWAKQLAAPAGESDARRLEKMFEVALSRLPTDDELRLLNEVLAEARARFATAPPASGQSVELAAWTQVTRTTLNLEEFITRE